MFSSTMFKLYMDMAAAARRRGHQRLALQLYRKALKETRKMTGLELQTETELQLVSIIDDLVESARL